MSSTNTYRSHLNVRRCSAQPSLNHAEHLSGVAAIAHSHGMCMYVEGSLRWPRGSRRTPHPLLIWRFSAVFRSFEAPAERYNNCEARASCKCDRNAQAQRPNKQSTLASELPVSPAHSSGANQKARDRPSLPCGRRKSLWAFSGSGADRVPSTRSSSIDWSASHGAVTVAEVGPEAAKPAGLGSLLVAGGG